MFESFDRGRAYRRRKAFILPGIFLAASALMLVQVRSVWSISKLAMPRNNKEIFAIGDRSTPPPAKLGGGAATPRAVSKPNKVKVTTVVQPVPKEAAMAQVTTQSITDAPPGPGVATGDENGELNGVGDGPACGKAGLPPCGTDFVADVQLAPTPPQQTIAPTTFKANRIAGTEQIQPDDMTKLEISRSGKTRLVASVKVCVDTEGNVASATKIGPGTGFAAYDAKLLQAVQRWQYRPFLVNGAAAPTCSVVQFIYMQN